MPTVNACSNHAGTGMYTGASFQCNVVPIATTKKIRLSQAKMFTALLRLRHTATKVNTTGANPKYRTLSSMFCA
jgi:hypothetical protein